MPTPDSETLSTSAERDLLTRIRERYQVMSEADQDNRKKALEDLRFVNEPGAQWDPNMKKERGSRQCLEFNKLRVNGKRVINEIRANRPRGKVRAVSDATKGVADLYEGLCRNIANVSDFDTITDQAAEYQVDAGMGAWRVVTQYSDDSSFDQDILVKSIANPLNLYWDPAAQDPMKRDAEDWIYTTRLSNSAFEIKYGEKAQKSNFEDIEFDDDAEWKDSETVRICEYWYRKPYDRTILQFKTPNGSVVTVDKEDDEVAGMTPEAGYQPVRSRMVKSYKIMMCVASGAAILEGPTEWVGSEFPFVVVFGEQKVIDGKYCWWGLHRFSKDAQQSYNISRTAIDETIAQSPKSKIVATSKQMEGLEKLWAEAHQKNFPFLPYNADPQAPGPPQMLGGPQIPVALIQQATIASQDIRDTSGLHEASFGEESGEKSGVALARKQNQAQIVTYNFPDNAAKGVARTWEIFIDLIPKIYDAEREIRIIGPDGQEEYQKVNQLVLDPQSGRTLRVNDLTTGKFDVTVTTGPSFATQRQEAAEIYANLFPANSPLYPLVADLIAKSQDLPYSDEMAERLKMALPPQVLQQMSQGKKLPPEVAAAQAQVQQQAQQVQQHGVLVQKAAQEAEQKKAEAEKAQADVRTAIADLKTQRAQFEAAVAKAEAHLTLKESQVQQQAGEDKITADREALANEVRQATAQLMGHMASIGIPNIVMPPHPKVVAIHSRRVNGNLVAVPEYEAPATGGTPPPPMQPPQGMSMPGGM